MPQLRPTWQSSFATAGVLLVVYVMGALVRRRRDLGEPGWAGRPGRAGRAGSATVTSFAGEFAVIMALLGFWQLVGTAVHTRVAGAMERGRVIHAWEAAWHLPSERALQAAVDVVPAVVHAADVYYAYAHLNGMALFVGWLWWRHRDAYGRARGVIISSTLACLVVQTVPVAPPRLLPEFGFVDTALRDGSSVYGAFGSGMANQLAAMPSVHVGWAVIVGWYVWRYGSRWGRWIGPLHAVLTVLVVVVTANHWWLDGLVATGFVALAELVIAGCAVPGGPLRHVAATRAATVTDVPDDRR
jgi:hypothetical protein